MHCKPLLNALQTAMNMRFRNGGNAIKKGEISIPAHPMHSPVLVVANVQGGPTSPALLYKRNEYDLKINVK